MVELGAKVWWKLHLSMELLGAQEMCSLEFFSSDSCEKNMKKILFFVG